MTRYWFGLLSALALFACSDDTTEDTSDGDGGASSGSGGDGGAVGGSPSSSSSAISGGGGAAVDRCPEVCDKMEALFASFGCALEECNCKAPCADLLEASIDCIPAGSADCSCSGDNELECTICSAENTAANDCWQMN
jgi:hypothetical protein